MAPTAKRAQPSRIPPATDAQQRAAETRRRYLREREWLEGRSMVRGLILLTIVALLASMVRAGFDRVFVPGWWRP
jgi:hypothetical protein